MNPLFIPLSLLHYEAIYLHLWEEEQANLQTAVSSGWPASVHLIGKVRLALYLHLWYFCIAFPSNETNMILASKHYLIYEYC